MMYGSEEAQAIYDDKKAKKLYRSKLGTGETSLAFD